MGVLKPAQAACLSLPPALPPVWREETPPNNLAPMFTSPHMPVPSSQLFRGHTPRPLEQEEPWEALCLVPHTRGLAHSRCSARSRCSADTCTHLGKHLLERLLVLQRSSHGLLHLGSVPTTRGQRRVLEASECCHYVFFFFFIQSPDTMCACFQKMGAVLFQGP